MVRCYEIYTLVRTGYLLSSKSAVCPPFTCPPNRKFSICSAEAQLAEALALMNNEGLTSVAVVDSGQNVVGNISTADVRLLTSAASVPLLKSSCMHFVSVILSERGVEHGRDSYPVFHVSPHSTLAHTVAKLVATRSHRMWVVESASPSPSAPATPLLTPSLPHNLQSPPPTEILLPSSTAPQSPLPLQSLPSPGIGPTPNSSTPSLSTSGVGSHLSGRLTGVVSLTDILNLFARSTGLRPSDPSEQRARRRRSSSSSVRPSLDSSRASVDYRR
jgi:CBS domain-containing protein